MEKRGIGHVEVILSFVIFIAVIGLALYFFNPGDSSRLVDSSLTYSFREIIENTSSDIVTFSVYVNKSALLRDLPNVESIGVAISGLAPELKANAESRGGKRFGARREGDITYVNASNAEWRNTDFLFLKYGEDLEETENTPGPENSEWYYVSSFRTDKLISEKRFLELNRSYHRDYISLREHFNLPSRVNFGFALQFSEKEVIKSEKEIPGGFETFSDTKRIVVLREGGGVEFGDLTVKVW